MQLNQSGGGHWTPTRVEFDDGYRGRAQLGFIVLATERTIEREMLQMAPPGVGVHFARVPMAAEVTVTNLRKIEAALAFASTTLLPDDPPDVISYACTSGSLVLGESVVAERICEGAPTTTPTSLIAGVVRALRAIDARRLTVVTPYIDEINEMEAEYLGRQGFEVVTIRGLGILHDHDMSRVTERSLAQFAVDSDTPDADTVFISCGALRTLDLIEEVEAEIGKPVVTSNQALMWDALRLAGVKDELVGYGRLLEVSA